MRDHIACGMNRRIYDCRKTAVKRVNRGGNNLLGYEIQLKDAGLRGLAGLYRFKQHIALGGFQPVKSRNATISIRKFFGKVFTVDVLKSGLHVNNGVVNDICAENAVPEDVLKSMSPSEQNKTRSAASVNDTYRSGIRSAAAVEGNGNHLIDSARNYR